MQGDDLVDSEHEENSEDHDDSSAEEEPGNDGDGRVGANQKLTAYEEQRLSRIQENTARLEAMGLRRMANCLMASGPRKGGKKGKKKTAKGEMEDEEYIPEEEDHDCSSSSSEDDAPKLRREKTSKPKKKAPVHVNLHNSEDIHDDCALMQAISLSLEASGELKSDAGPFQSSTVAMKARPDECKQSADIEEGAKRKRKKPTGSRVQMTEDDLILHFFQFDEAAKGGISIRDLQRVTNAHDFTWSDKELADMIYCFDNDGDGKLNLDEFRSIVRRCNLLQVSEV